MLLAGRPVLDHVVTRVSAAERIDEVVVATTDLPGDDAAYEVLYENISTDDQFYLVFALVILGGVFWASNLSHPWVKRFFTVIPALLLCYFLPSLLTTFGGYPTSAVGIPGAVPRDVVEHQEVRVLGQSPRAGRFAGFSSTRMVEEYARRMYFPDPATSTESASGA